MGCIPEIVKQVEKEGGCGNFCKYQCLGMNRYSEEELKYGTICSGMNLSRDRLKTENLRDNKNENMELLKKLYDENEILTNKLRAKIAELITKAQMNEEVVVIGTGNSCGCPCYKYNLNLIKTCPKCKGKVEEDFENGYTMVKKYNSRKEAYEEVKQYNLTKICTAFKWNNKDDIKDLDYKECFKYYTKVDNEKKNHWTIKYKDKTTNEMKTEEIDLPTYYMMVDGERFDFTAGMDMQGFFIHNNKTLFPEGPNERGWSGKAYKIQFQFEGIEFEFGAPFGYYGYARMHMVYIYTCNLCGHKYHIIKPSPFAFSSK
jgi:hypothetical protein